MAEKEALFCSQSGSHLPRPGRAGRDGTSNHTPRLGIPVPFIGNVQHGPIQRESEREQERARARAGEQMPGLCTEWLLFGVGNVLNGAKGCVTVMREANGFYSC